MRHVLVLAFTDLARDPRVDRQLRALAGRYRVTAVGLGAPGVAGVAFVPLTARPNGLWRRLGAAAALACRRHERYYWHKSLVREAHARLMPLTADLVIANDLVTLPLALRVARGAKVLFDAHEYAPRELENEWGWDLLMRPFAEALCRRYLPRVDAMTTVCDGIADAYHDLAGVRPTVITNAPDYHELTPQPYRAAERPLRLVHHGLLYPPRRIENTIRMMDLLGDRCELSLVLTGPNQAYLRRLQALARGRPNVRFLPPVPMRTLPAFLNQFDLGVFLLEPVNYNYRLALPNKLFEFIQARLGVAIGPSPEMARVVTAAGCGVVAPDFRPASLAACLRRLSEADVNALKERAHAAAPALSARTNERIFLGIVDGLWSERAA